MTSGNCPRCGGHTDRGQPFCPHCGLDLRTAVVPNQITTPQPNQLSALDQRPAEEGPAPASTSTATPAKPTRLRTFVTVAVVLLVLVGVIVGLRYAGRITAPPGTVDLSFTPSPPPATFAVPSPPSTPTPSPKPTTLEAGLNVPVEVTHGGTPTMLITVESIVSSTGFGDFDKPAPGSVFIAAKVKYVSELDGADYGSLDWSVYGDGTQKGAESFVTNDAWQPALSAGGLPSGRSDEGWIVFEVPRPAHSVTLSYTENIFLDPVPIFEVSVRCCS